MHYRVRLRPSLTAGILVTLLTLSVPFFTGVVPATAQPTPTPTPQPSPSPRPTPAPTVTPRAPQAPDAPSPAPSPTAAPSPAPGPSPTPMPSPTPPPPPKVTEVVVRGLERLPESIVFDSIGVRVGELLSDERLRADVAALIATGWFADANIRVEPTRDGVRVAFIVIENPIVNQVVFEGNTVIPSADLERTLNLPTGQVLNILRLRDGTRAIEKLYEERGYVLARVVDIGITTDGDVRLRLRVSEGRVEAVEYKGLSKTKRFVVDRGAIVRPGSLFNINDLNRDLQRLVALDLFENVQARPRPGSTPDQVIVEIEVKEQRTQQARFGLGYSDRTGIVGLVEYTEKSWQGRNQSLTLRVERGLGERNVPNLVGPAGSNFSITFRDPWVDARQTAMEISLYQTTAFEVEFTGSTVSSRFNIERLGSAIGFTRPLDPQTALTLRLRSEQALIVPLPLDPAGPSCNPPPDPLCPAPVNILQGRTVAFTLAAARDRRDNRLAPTRGDRILLTADLGVPVLGGNFSFGKYSAEYSRYFTAGSGVLVGRALVGVSHGGLPLQEQFFLGGPSTLRAFPVGRFRGNDVGLVNLEYRMPLGGLLRQLRDLTGVAFVDAGTAPISAGIQVGYGIGVSVGTAVGPIRIDFAWGSGGQQTWITIGQPF